MENENKKKGKRPSMQREEQYLELYFKAHSMDAQCGVSIDEDENINMKDEENPLQVIGK